MFEWMWAISCLVGVLAMGALYFGERHGKRNALRRLEQVEKTAADRLVVIDGLQDKAALLKGDMTKRAEAGEISESDLTVALAVPESHPLLRAVLQVMDGQREELLQDAAEQGIDPSESMARSRGADALRESADEIWQLVRQANVDRTEDDASASKEDAG